MRNGQNKRMRGRHNNQGHGGHGGGGHGHRKNHNPMARVYESNGPEVKIRGNPAHIAEKYMQLARDAQSSGDPVAAENYYQHAEHYFRLIAAAQEQFRQNNPHLPRPEGEIQGARDDAFEEGSDDDGQQPTGGDQAFGTREPQPYLPRDAQPFPQQQPYQQQQPPQQQPHQQHQPRPHQGGAPNDAQSDVDRLPSFITGGQPQQAHQGNGQNGHDSGNVQGDRFPLHRRRRRHRGPRHETAGGPGDGDSSRD
jgi:hypothetical protein